jgi:hypothetical protein
MNVNDLLKLNVNDHTERKGNLTYLSWAWAWAKALEADPAATWDIQMFNGKCFMEINNTAMVFVTTQLFGKQMTCQLPVMDHRNKAVLNPDSFQINTAIMRCMTKSLSLHGLGLYIYAGEDLPGGEEPESSINESEMMDYMALFEECVSIEALQKAFVQAIAATDGDKEWQKKLISKKDEIKKKLGGKK